MSDAVEVAKVTLYGNGPSGVGFFTDANHFPEHDATCQPLQRIHRSANSVP